MIQGAVLHFASEQPLVCDLRALPTAADVCITVTNLRFLDGRKPGFIDHTESWFLYPLVHIRFIEIPQAAMAASDLPALPAGEPLERDDESDAGRSLAVPDDDLSDVDDAEEAAHAEELLKRMRQA